MTKPNPYESPAISPDLFTEARQKYSERAFFFAALCQAILGGMGVFFGLYGAAFWGLVLLDRNPLYPHTPDTDPIAIQTVVFSMIMTIQCLLMSAGGISMFQRKWRWLAITGAWAGIMPVCGCYLITLISGIWILFVLRRPEVKAMFASQSASSSINSQI